MARTSPAPPEAAVVLRNRQSPFKRAVLGTGGAAALILPAADLWDGLVVPSLVAPFFWVIVLGAAAVGAAFLAGAVLGDETELRVAGGRITLARANLLRKSLDSLAPGDIRAVTIVAHEWESRPETYSVEVRLTRGRPVCSGEIATREAAEALAGRLRAALGRG